MKARSTIRRALKGLRDTIDNSSEPVETRVAYAMEHAIRWATLKTTRWPSLDKEAKFIAQLIKEENKK